MGLLTPAAAQPDALDTVLGHDGRAYRALTIAMVDLHLRTVIARIKGAQARRLPNLAEGFRQDRDQLLERRSYLMLMSEDDPAD